MKTKTLPDVPFFNRTYEGKSKVGKKVWRWDWHPYFGPIFKNKDGSVARREPGPKSKVWQVVERWAKKREFIGWTTKVVGKGTKGAK